MSYAADRFLRYQVIDGQVHAIYSDGRQEPRATALTAKGRDLVRFQRASLDALAQREDARARAKRLAEERS